MAQSEVWLRGRNVPATDVEGREADRVAAAPLRPRKWRRSSVPLSKHLQLDELVDGRHRTSVTCN